MSLSDAAIQRPVLTWMMTLALIVFGLLGYQRLGVDQYPSMELPMLTVTAVLPGASPEVMETDVVDVIEEQITTLSGVRSVRSTSAQDAAQIAVEFQLGTDLDLVAQQLRDVIGRVRAELPPALEPLEGDVTLRFPLRSGPSNAVGAGVVFFIQKIMEEDGHVRSQ